MFVLSILSGRNKISKQSKIKKKSSNRRMYNQNLIMTKSCFLYCQSAALAELLNNERKCECNGFV